MAQAKTTYKARNFRYLLLLVLIIWAVISLAARYVLSDLSQYQARIEQLVSEKTPYRLSIDELEGRWLGFSPLIEMKGLVLSSKNENASNDTEEYIVKISHLAIEINIIESIFTFSPRIKQLLINDVDLNLVQNPINKKISLRGLVLDTDSKTDTKELINKLLEDFILSSGEIYLNNIRIGLALEKINKGQLTISAATLANDWFNHEIAAYITLQDNSDDLRRLRFSSTFQGNPLDIDKFSAHSFIELEETDLGFWVGQINIPNLSVPNIKLGMQSWFDIKQGVLEDISFTLNASNIEIVQKNIQLTHQIQSLSALLAVHGNVQLLKVFDKEYLSSLRYEHTSLQIRNLDVDWDDLHINNFSTVVEQLNTKKLASPLKKQWHDFQKIPFSNIVSNELQEEKSSNTILYRAIVNHIPLSLIKKVSPFIAALEPLQEKINEAAPYGSLKDLQVAMYVDEDKKPEIYASVYARNLGISSVAKIPAIRGIDFYAELAPTGLGIELETEDAKLAEDFYLFRKDLNITKAKGNLFLERLSGDIVVHSDIVELQNDWIEANVSFALSIPERFYADGVKEIPAWSLQASFKSIPAADALMFFPGRLSPTFLDWIDNFVLNGAVDGDIMLFAFAKKREPDTFALLDADINLNDGKLDYLPGKWPMLNDVNGNILVHNDQVKATVPAASVFNTRLYNATVFIPSYLNENLPRVKVQGNVSGSLQDVQKLFLESELKYSLGSVVEDWVLFGTQNASVDIDLPISDSPKNYESKLDVELSVVDALIAVPSVGLGVKELSSEVHYSFKDGLTANAIKAKFFDKEVRGRITTKDATGDQVIQIFAEGDVNSEDLRSWQDFWVFNNLQGSAHFNARIAVGREEAIEQVLPMISKKDELVISGFANKKVTKAQAKKSVEVINDDSMNDQASIVRVEVLSDLKNLAVNLPGSYAKAKVVAQPTRLQFDVFPESMIYRLDYGTRLGISAKTIGDDFERARIHFGEGSFVLPAEKGITVTGHIDELDFDSWLAYFEKNLFDEDIEPTKNMASHAVVNEKIDATKKQTDEKYDPASILHIVDVSISSFFGFDQTLKDLKVQVTREPFVWRVELENDIVAGVVYVPDEELITKDNPIIANLKYLKFTEEQFSSSESSVKNGKLSEDKTVTIDAGARDVAAESNELKPEDFSFMKLDIANVTLDKTKHGRWQLDIFPDENGVDFKIHQLNYGLMAINGSGRWDYREDYSATRFKGHLRTSAITKIFSALSLRPSSKSKGFMAIDIKWLGSPFDFESDTMKGTAALEIFDGSIVEVDISSKKFKALGIFNLGVITDILTLRIFKKIGKGIDKALNGSEQNEKSNAEGKVNKNTDSPVVNEQ